MEAPMLVLLSCLAAGADPDFLGRHDMVWEAPPVAWNTGIPLGNGFIGAMVWGDGQPLKITLDKYDAWETREKPLDVTYADLRRMVAEGRREEAEQCMRTERIYGDDPYPTRLPLPRAELRGNAASGIDPKKFGARLNLAQAEATVFDDDTRIRIVVPRGRPVVHLRCTGPGVENLQLDVGFDHLSESARETLKRWGYPDPVIERSDDGGILAQRTPSGYSYAVAWKRTVFDGGVAIALTLVSSEDAADPEAEAKRTAEEWAVPDPDLSAHRQGWADHWQRSFLTVPDARFEALYYIEMYKLACSSQPGGLPLTLQGVWTLDGGMPPWSGDYHLDMNVQQSYWPVYAANRLELGEPLYRIFSECIPRWRQQCRNFFGFDGVWSGCAIGPRGERIFGYSGVELWPGNAAWLAHHYWLHYRYSMDKTFLREQALPMLRLCFLTYANLLEEGDDGRLHLPLSYSPEYHEGGFKGYAADPNGDLALIRFLGDAILQANDALGEEDPLTARVREVLEKLTDYVHEDGRLWVSAGQPLEHSHRHHSHLMMIHPLGLVTPEGGPEDRRMIERSLRDIRTKGTGEWTGWAFPWMSLIASRAGYGNWAWQMLDNYANGFITPNTFHINGDPRVFGVSLFEYDPMTLEAGFGAAAALQEMLLQSQGGIIRLFPSMPDRWHDAYFENLRAEGAFLVTAKRAAGRTVFVRVVSEAGGPCRVRNPFGGPAVLRAGEETRTLDGGVLGFETQPGREYTLHPAAAEIAPDMTPLAFERAGDELHFYGLKKLPRF